jgi:hypothetical protein
MVVDKNDNNEGYRGYVNYETWRVMSDYFGDMDLNELDMLLGNVDYDKTLDQRIFSASIPIESYVDEMLDEKAPRYILESFTNNVDYYELAATILEQRQEFLDYEE